MQADAVVPFGTAMWPSTRGRHPAGAVHGTCPLLQGTEGHTSWTRPAPSNTFLTTSRITCPIGLSRPTVLGHTERYDAIAQAITHGSAARFNFQVQRLDLAPSHHLAQAIEACDLYLFLYDSSTLPNPRAEGPTLFAPCMRSWLEHWKKSLLFKDYGDYFYDTFSVEPQRIADSMPR